MRIVRLDIHVSDFGSKGGMSAVVRPISVDNFEFRFARVTLFTRKIISHELEVRYAHCKAFFGVILSDLLVAHSNEAVYSRHGELQVDLTDERIRQNHIALSRLYGVDEVLLDSGYLAIRAPLDSVDFSALDERSRTHRQQLHALHSAVCSLVVLSRQILYHEDGITRQIGEGFV